MADTYYLQNRIQLEINNLERGHVYYSIDEQPEVCARLVARGIRGRKSFNDAFQELKEETEQVMKQVADDLGFDPRETMGNLFKNFGRGFTEGIDKMAAQEIHSHRVSVTVQSWDDVPAAIGLIRQRQQDFKKRNNL